MPVVDAAQTDFDTLMQQGAESVVEDAPETAENAPDSTNDSLDDILAGLDSPEEPEAPQEDTSDGVDYEEQAKRQGWVDKDDYKGDPEEWVDAKTFVERGKEINAILRGQNDRLNRQLSQMEQRYKEQLEAQQRELAELKESLNKRDSESFESQLASLKKARRQAMLDSDMEAALQYEDRIEELERNRPSKPSTTKPAKQGEEQQQQYNDPATKEWIGSNSWFGQNKTKTHIAIGMAEDLRAEGYTGGSDFFHELDKRLKQQFPEQFGGKKPKTSAMESGGTPPKGGRKNKTVASLPADAKQALKTMRDMGMIKTKADVQAYIDEYYRNN